MTDKVRIHAAQMLINSCKLSASMLYIPEVYVVDVHCYWFRNVARRAAYETHQPIEKVTIYDAFYLLKPGKELNSRLIDEHFEQVGSTFNDNRLFCNSDVRWNAHLAMTYESTLK
jgi:hypothetical protein